MKVAVTQPIYSESLKRLREAGHDVLELWRSDLTLTQPLPDVTGVVCQLTDRIDSAFLSGNPSLRVVANVAVGFDNIDVEAAARQGVIVTNTPGVLTDATADLAFALLFAAARRLPECDAYVRGGSYEGWELMQHPMGLDITGQTIGIVGMGRVGQAVATRARLGFAMDVLYTDSSSVKESEQSLGARRVELPELLASSDFVSLHAPLTPHTHHLIDGPALSAMKPTSILVNTARGPLVNEAALSSAIDAGSIAGAGLDVYENEPAVFPGLLRQRERVVLTPHVGSATGSTRRRMSDMAVDNVIAVLDGRPAHDPVTSRP